MSKGEFQFDMWGVDKNELMWDWNSLKVSVKEYGICNSLFTAQMPVASSAKITGSYEMTEVIPSNLFNRRVVGGEFLIANRYLIEDFEDLGIWSETFKNEIIMNEGSIQNINFNKFLDPNDKHYEKKIKRIEHLIPKYKTIWEISQRELIDMAAEGVEPGITAIFAAVPDRYGPVIPGPLRKNPNTSLNDEFTNSGYSSEAKTNLNCKLLPLGIKSNSIIVLLSIVFVVNKSKSGSPADIVEGWLSLSLSLGPIATWAFPVAKIIPLVKPILVVFPFENLPTLSCIVLAAAADPLNVIFETVTPVPNKTCWTNSSGVKVLSIVICADDVKPTKTAIARIQFFKFIFILNIDETGCLGIPRI